MKLINKTNLEGIEKKVYELVMGYNGMENLQVKIKYTKENAKTPYSGVCYYREDKIRVSINPKNRYPLKITVGSPFNKSSWQNYYLNSEEELALFVFLHEISHYIDYKNGLSVRCKQTKADKFALWKMGKLKE
jgi:hypothetical protein